MYYDTSDFSATPSIRSLDLVTGEIATIFQVPSGGWVYYLSASPDGKNLVISYLPLAEEGSSASQALYVLPIDGSTEPQLLLSPATPSDQFIQVEWSPDGKYIYYVHVNQKLPFATGQMTPVYTLYRISYPNGEQETVADNAFWPRLSSDSTHLVYVSSDPFAPENRLYIANADGSDAHEIALEGASVPAIKDAPFFTPDGQTVIFSAPVSGQAYIPTWLDRLTGVINVKAHSVPSDWWSVPVTGGSLVRLTQIQTFNLFASLSSDQTHIASLSGKGIFVMKLDGSELTQIYSTNYAFGAISWVP